MIATVFNLSFLCIAHSQNKIRKWKLIRTTLWDCCEKRVLELGAPLGSALGTELGASLGERIGLRYSFFFLSVFFVSFSIYTINFCSNDVQLLSCTNDANNLRVPIGPDHIRLACIHK
jgi:hypothetical protein